jgi:glutamate racemase
MSNQPKIGIFDSGVGGLSMANAIKKELPDLALVIKSDKAHFPYGNKSLNEIYAFTKPLIEELIKEDCQVIVVACNTVTTNFISRLRQEFNIPFVGMEPMVKPAAQASMSKIIAVCATPRTLSSDRYKTLKDDYCQGVKVIEPDCSDWAGMIETDSLDMARIDQIVDDACVAGADQIVLGCTHYHWIEQEIKTMAEGRAEVLQPEEPVINQLKKVLAQLA